MNNLVSDGKHLLFVDDEESIRAMLPVILRGRGFDVVTAASVPEALHTIKGHEFDVLLSDLNLREPRDGYEIVRAIRKANPRCVAVILTGYPNFDSVVDGVRYDIDDYFVKPVDIDSLIASLQRSLAARLSD